MEYNTGTGIITIQNIGSKDLKDATIIVYLEDGGLFTKYQSGEFVTFDSATSGSTRAEYNTSEGKSKSTAKYIEIKVYNLAAQGGDIRKSDKIKVHFAYQMPSSDKKPVVAVFSESPNY